MADELGLEVHAVRRRVKSGELPAIRLGKSDHAPLRVRRDALEEYIDRHKLKEEVA